MPKDTHTDPGIPESPEDQAPYVREDLDQDMMTHHGDWRKALTAHAGENLRGNGGKHLGATDDEVVPVVPPMSGPADLVGERDQNGQGNEDGDTQVGEELYDPRDELTPG